MKIRHDYTSENSRLHTIPLLIFLLVGFHYFNLPTFHLIGNVNLKIETLLFFVLMFFTLLTFLLRRLVVSRDCLYVVTLPLVGLFYVFYGVTVDNNLHRAFFEFEPMMFYLSFLFPFVFIRHPRDSEYLLKCIIVSAIIFLPLLLIQYALSGFGIELVSSKEVVIAWGKLESRHVPYAKDVLLLVSLYFFLRCLRDLRLGVVFIIISFVVALILTFSRNLWIAFMFGIVILSWYEKRQTFRRVPVTLIAIAFIGMAVFLIFRGTTAGHDLITRAEMISPSAIQTDKSLIWRMDENAAAWKEILKAPILGHGLGYSYHSASSFEGAEYYLHNNYLLLWLKMGMLGLIATVLVLYEFLRTSLRIYRIYHSNNIISGMAISFFSFVLAMIPAAFIKPIFVSDKIAIILLSVVYGALKKLELLHPTQKELVSSVYRKQPINKHNTIIIS